MSAMPRELATVAAVDTPSDERIEFIKCGSSHCRHNLGVRLPRGQIHWHVPVEHNYLTGVTRVECPVCKAARVWTPRPMRGPEHGRR